MENYIKHFERLVIFLVVFIILGLIGSVIAYRSVFDGTLSELSADWGAVGGFFGGIFTPLIAFATLLAIVITIQLQKQLLETQNREFSKLYDLQKSTLDVQTKELEQAKKQLSKQAINEQKKLYIGLIEQQTDIRRNTMERALESAMDLLQKQHDGFFIQQSVINESLDQKELHEKQVQVLTYVSIGFTLQRFDTIEEMDKSITRLFQMIDNPKLLNALYASKGQSFDFKGGETKI